MEAHDQHDDRSPVSLHFFCRHRMLPTFELRIKIASLLLSPLMKIGCEKNRERIDYNMRGGIVSEGNRIVS